MKKTIQYIMTTLVITGSILVSCNTKEEKTKEENTEATETEIKAEESKPDKAKVELNAEYSTYRANAEKRIAFNQKRIEEMKSVVNQPGKLPFVELRKKRIKELEAQNAALRTRLYGYEKEPSDWESFKREFDHDMKTLGEAFDDFGKDNTK